VISEQEPTQGWVLYDDSCGFCSRWVPFWAPTLRRRGFAIAPLQADWVQARLALDSRSLLEDLRLLLNDGRQVVGADVYRHVMRRIWWAWPAYGLSRAPVFSSVFDRCYRLFATYRHRVSAACGLRARRPVSDQPIERQLPG
jgi:predicted DCC family thiol-disulfide oxidoreductase YuxK